MEINIWVEKYRPKTLKDLLLSEDKREIFNKYLSEKDIPNLIFYGSPGVGKTSTALIFIKELGCDYLRLNGSDQRSIDIVRDEIKNFIFTKSFNKKKKIVFYDEAEKITKDAFDALKEITERYYKNCSFIFCTNSINVIPKVIRSRFNNFNFTPIEKKDTIIFYKNVLDKENIKYNEEDLEKVFKVNNGDLRSSLNFLQKNSMFGELKVPSMNFSELINLYKDKNIKGLKEYLNNNSIEYDYLYRFFYDKTIDPVKLIIIGKYFISHSQVLDPEINFVAMICELIKLDKK